MKNRGGYHEWSAMQILGHVVEMIPYLVASLPCHYRGHDGPSGADTGGFVAFRNGGPQLHIGQTLAHTDAGGAAGG